MPIRETDPWRLQYFDNVPCPDNVWISTEDQDSWAWYPQHRWIYDKLAVALSQGLAAAPHGVMPAAYPIFSKPIVNLRGMGVGSQAFADEAAYVANLTAGHFWTELLTGRHVSSDVAVIDGAPQWWRHTEGIATEGGTFDYWQVHATGMPEVEAWCGAWLRKHLRGYTGMANLETIGGKIIEGHLRFADQWPDLNGAGWVSAVVRLYTDGVWAFPDTDRRDGFSVVSFAPHGVRYRHPPAALVREIAGQPGISSVQITFHEDKDPARHAMPPGGFRIAVINCTDLAAGRTARERLRQAIVAAS
jgi:hypothetical protein